MIKNQDHLKLSELQYLKRNLLKFSVHIPIPIPVLKYGFYDSACTSQLESELMDLFLSVNLLFCI